MFLRKVLGYALEDLSQSSDRLDGRLDRFRNVFILDTTVVTLYQSLTDAYPDSGDDHAGASSPSQPGFRRSFRSLTHPRKHPALDRQVAR